MGQLQGGMPFVAPLVRAAVLSGTAPRSKAWRATGISPLVLSPYRRTRTRKTGITIYVYEFQNL